MPTPEGGIDFQKRTLVLIAAVLFLRLLYAAIFPVNPAGDEAYYWDWGRQLDYGYFSKPPLIAWLYAIVDWIGQGGLFAIRATAAVLATASILLLFKLTSALFDERTGWLAAVLALAAPANSVLGFFLTIDAPLVFCWSVALWMFWRYVSGEGKAGTLLALFAALAIGHLSKQMMMVFPVLAVIFLLLDRSTRPLLRRSGLTGALFGSYLALVPPLVWNAKHDWITFKHTGHHFETSADGENFLLERAEDFLAFLGTQLGVLSPVTGVALLSVSLAGLGSVRSASRPVRFLLVFGALPLAAMLLLALRQELQPNWPAVYYVSGLALTAAWYGGHFTPPFPPPAWRRHYKIAVATGVGLVLFFYFGTFVFQAFGLAGHQADPNRRMMSHDLMAREFQEIRSAQPNAEEMFIATVGHRDIASHLAFGLPDQPRVYHWDWSARIDSQYELWNDPSQDGFEGKDGLILVPGSKGLPGRLAKAFGNTTLVGEFEIPRGLDEPRSFSVHRGEDLKKWPAGVPLSQPPHGRRPQ
ncbi:MAG: glycosyltransferase family 39 protein [Verrucomicrobiales bacterium]